jgi:hypothetical protein
MTATAFFSKHQHTNKVVSSSEKVYHLRCDRWFDRSTLKRYGKTTGETIRTRRDRYICPVCSIYDAHGKILAMVTFTGYKPGAPALTKPYTQNLENDHA